MQRTNIYLSDWQKEQLQPLGKHYDTNTSALIRLTDLCFQRIAEGDSLEAEHITEPSHAKVAA